MNTLSTTAVCMGAISQEEGVRHSIHVGLKVMGAVKTVVSILEQQMERSAMYSSDCPKISQ